MTETDVTVTQKQWTMRYTDAFVPIKLDMLRDSPMNILDWITQRIGKKFGKKREQLLLNGEGGDSLEPVGMLTNDGVLAGITEVGIDTAVTTSVLLNFIRKLPQEYRAGATALMDAAPIFEIAAQLAPNVRSAQYLIGMLPPMKESGYMSSGTILVGDFSEYVVFYNKMMELISGTIPRRYSMDLVFVEKWDGLVATKDAFRLGTGVSYS